MTTRSKIVTLSVSEIDAPASDDLADDLDTSDYPPIIVAVYEGGYDLIDGHHRLCGAINGGHQTIRCQVASQYELDQSRDFGDGDMAEADWISWMQARAGY